MALITPEKLAELGSEDGTQKAYIQAIRTRLQAAFPEVMLTYHVPNGGQRGEATMAAKTMSNFKAMGLVTGVPDICMPVSRDGFHSLYIEFKRPDGKGELEQEQYDFILKLTANGNLVAICDNWQHAYDITSMYLSQDLKMRKILNQDYHFGIRPLALIDVGGYVAKLVRKVNRRK